MSAQVTQPNATGLAIFQRVVHERSRDSMDVCLKEGVLRTATISAYINSVFSWTASADAFGAPAPCSMSMYVCLHLAAAHAAHALSSACRTCQLIDF